MTRLALLPALWLALGGAAAAPAMSLLDMTECRLNHDQVVAGIPTLKLSGTRDNTTTGPDPKRYISRTLVVPPDFKVFGFTPRTVGVSDQIPADGVPRITIMSIIVAPYAEVERGVLAARGGAPCETRSDTSCLVFARRDKDWQTGLFIGNHGQETTISCMFLRASD